MAPTIVKYILLVEMAQVGNILVKVTPRGVARAKCLGVGANPKFGWLNETILAPRSSPLEF